MIDIQKKAVIIENHNRFINFRRTCNEHSIKVVSYQDKIYPVYEMLFHTPNGIYAIPNTSLETSPYSVYENGYITISYELFLAALHKIESEKNLQNEKKNQILEEKSTTIVKTKEN